MEIERERKGAREREGENKDNIVILIAERIYLFFFLKKKFLFL